MRAVPALLIYLLPAIVAGALAALTWRRRYIRGGQPFTLLMLALCWWCGCHALAILDPTFDGTVFWLLLQYVGIVLVGPSWLLLALANTGNWWRTHRWFRLAVFAPELLILMLVLTNNLHHLFWVSVEPDTSRGFMWMQNVRGPAFLLHSIYAYACILAGAVLLARDALGSAAEHRYHARLMLIALLIPVVGNIIFLTGVGPALGDDPTPLLLLGSGIMAFYATMRYRLVDLAPLAERAIFAGLPDGLIVVDTLGHIADANDLAPKLLGVPGGRWAGRPLAQIAAGSPVIDELRALLAAAPQAVTRQVAYQAEDGLRALELRLRPLIAGNGAASGSLLLLRDISERVRVEQARAQHLEELSLISRVARAANTASDSSGLLGTIAEVIAGDPTWDRVAIGLLDGDGARFRIVADRSPRGGPSYEGLPSASPDSPELMELLAERVARPVDLDDPAGPMSSLRARLRADGLRALVAVPLFHQDAPLGLLLLGSAAPLVAGPARLRLAETIGELITDAVVRIGLYEEVRRADRLKSSFLASVSHELRTPLTAIIGYIDMLKKGIYGQPAPTMGEPLGYMRHSSLTLLRLINDILDFSRMEAGHLQVDIHPVDVRRAVVNVIGQLQPQIVERGLELRSEIDDDLPPAMGNAHRMEQVLTNLLTNAIKFTERGSIVVTAAPSGDAVRISVSDTGIGIAPEHQALIFEEFRRVDTPNGRRYGGAGLGLAITRRLIELMGGSISVSSTPGVGTTFACELPLAPPVVAARTVGMADEPAR